jgi:hypothetical protein
MALRVTPWGGGEDQLERNVKDGEGCRVDVYHLNILLVRRLVFGRHDNYVIIYSSCMRTTSCSGSIEADYCAIVCDNISSTDKLIDVKYTLFSSCRMLEFRTNYTDVIENKQYKVRLHRIDLMYCLDKDFSRWYNKPAGWPSLSDIPEHCCGCSRELLRSAKYSTINEEHALMNYF